MKYAIIGGGIGGLTMAVALHRLGIEADVYEAAPRMQAVGAGIWMPANALQVLDRLGLAKAIAEAGAVLQRAEVHDAAAGLLQTVDMAGIAGRFGFATVAIHRARLQAILAGALPPAQVHVGYALDALEPLADGVQMRFTNGETRIAQVVIGADGLRSRVRGLLFPGAALRYSGQTSWRGIARVRLPEALRDIGRETWSAGCRFGFSHIASNEVYWFAVQDAAANGRDEPGESLARLRRTFGRFPAPTAEILGSTAADEVIRTDLSDLRRLPSWSAGRVALLGDAAHATTPNLGQGGAQAVEDAWVLARCLKESAHHAQAFAKYEAMRRRKVDRVVTTSWWLGKLAHVGNPVGRSLRNAALRATPARVGERRMHELFEVSP